MTRWFLAVVLLLGSVASVSAIAQMNVVVFPDVASTTFAYNFVFSSAASCSPVLLNASASITTNLAGRGNATIDTSSLTNPPAYMCTYRDGVLVNTQSLNANAFENFATSVAFVSVGNWSGNISLYTTSANLVGALGNWTLDKPNYALNTYVSNIGNWSGNRSLYTTSANLVGALGNWTLDKPSYALITYVSNIGNWSGNITSYTASNLLVGALGNWTLDKPNYATIAHVTTIGNWSGNISLYTTSANLVGALGNWTLDKPNYATLTHVTSIGNWSGNITSYTASNLLVGALGNWSADKSNYSNTSTNNILYQSRFGTGVANQVLVWTNSTNATAYLVNATMLNVTTKGNTGQVLTINSSGGMNWTTTPLTVMQTTTASSTSTTLYTRIPELDTTLDGNSTYSVFCNFLTTSGAAATGEQLQLNLTGSPTNATFSFNSQVSATTRTSFQQVGGSSLNFADTGSAGIGVLDITQLYGLVITSSNPSTLSYAVKSETGTAIAYSQGSSCVYTKI